MKPPETLTHGAPNSDHLETSANMTTRAASAVIAEYGLNTPGAVCGWGEMVEFVNARVGVPKLGGANFFEDVAAEITNQLESSSWQGTGAVQVNVDMASPAAGESKKPQPRNHDEWVSALAQFASGYLSDDHTWRASDVDKFCRRFAGVVDHEKVIALIKKMPTFTLLAE